jgi:hypothetical protein
MISETHCNDFEKSRQKTVINRQNSPKPSDISLFSSKIPNENSLTFCKPNQPKKNTTWRNHHNDFNSPYHFVSGISLFLTFRISLILKCSRFLEAGLVPTPFSAFYEGLN